MRSHGSISEEKYSYILAYNLCDIGKSRTSGGSFRPQRNSRVQYHQWPLGKQEARVDFSPFPGWKLHPRLLAVTLIIFFLQQTRGHVNLNFPGGRFKRTSAHIFLPLSLEKKKKNWQNL